MEDKKKEYNDIPVYYCRHCLHLLTTTVARLENSDYCCKCGSTNIGQCHIEEWERLYIEKYGHRFLDNKY